LCRDQKKKPGKLLSEQTVQEDSEGSEYLPSESEPEDVEGLWFYILSGWVLFLGRTQWNYFLNIFKDEEAVYFCVMTGTFVLLCTHINN
jgi:hypothetical protein